MRFIIVFAVIWYPVFAVAELGSLMMPRQPNLTTQPSLFIGNAKGGLFAPYPVRTAVARTPILPPKTNSAIDRLRTVIGRAESPRAGYDAVQHGAKRKPRKKPTQMTIGEILDWIAATPGQPHAIGRYQFIPKTLRSVVAQTGTRRNEYFSPKVQDRLADVLLNDAGIKSFMAGRMGEGAFINNLAAIWAGLPTTSGRSKYHGYAGNRATVSLAYVKSQIAQMRSG